MVTDINVTAESDNSIGIREQHTDWVHLFSISISVNVFQCFLKICILNFLIL